jgi:cell wall-associated NlpC family hydrolase
MATFPMDAAAAHARECYPLEAGGLWVEGADGTAQFRSCGGGAADRFRISPAEWLGAERAGAIRGIFHSHPDAPPVPSPADAAAMGAWGLPWVIMSVPSMEAAEYVPEKRGAPRPLLGRHFEYGGDDCFGLIRDYYGRLGIAIPDFAREQGWEERGMNLYLDNYGKAGFNLVGDGPRPHDVLLMQVHSPVPNHGAIYLGDGLMLHHINTRLSATAVYGDFYRKATTHILRHGDLC